MRTEKMPKRAKSKFQSWRKQHGVSIPDAAALFAVTHRTIRNCDKNDAPPLANRMIAMFNRDLGGLHPHWKGISIKPNGKMYFSSVVGGTQTTVGLTAEHIRHYPATINQLHHYENDAHAQARLVTDTARKQLMREIF